MNEIKIEVTCCHIVKDVFFLSCRFYSLLKLVKSKKIQLFGSDVKRTLLNVDCRYAKTTTTTYSSI